MLEKSAWARAIKSIRSNANAIECIKERLRATKYNEHVVKVSFNRNNDDRKEGEKAITALTNSISC